MAKKDIKKGRIGTVAKAAAQPKWNFPLEKNDLIWICVGIGVIIVGYLLMMTGVTEEPATVDGKWNNPLAVVVAPIMLVVGYCVIVPMAILKVFRKKTANTDVTSSAE